MAQSSVTQVTPDKLGPQSTRPIAREPFARGFGHVLLTYAGLRPSQSMQLARRIEPIPKSPPPDAIPAENPGGGNGGLADEIPS